jgi:hypothetical protein
MKFINFDEDNISQYRLIPKLYLTLAVVNKIEDIIVIDTICQYN